MKLAGAPVVSIALALALGFGPSAAESPASEIAGFETLHAFFEQRAAAGLAFVAAIAQGDDVVFCRGYGSADSKRGRRNRPETAFAIGSIAKTFTAAAVYRLAREGGLALDDLLAEHFPDAPPDKAGITVEQILQHTSGLAQYHDRRGDFERMNRDQALAAIFARPLQHPPGERYAYSNAGYTLLALLVEKVSAEPFREHLRRHLLAPHGLDHTGFYGERERYPGGTARGRGHRRIGDNDPANWRADNLWALLGAGGMVSTAHDLVRWAAAREKLFPPPRPPADLNTHRRFDRGWYLRTRPTTGLQVFHGGANDMGFLAMLRSYPERDTTLVLLSNTYRDKKPHIRSYLDKIEDLLFGAGDQGSRQEAVGADASVRSRRGEGADALGAPRPLP